MSTTKAAEWWSLFMALSRENQLRYATILRQTDPRLNEMADLIEDWARHRKD